MSISSQKLLRNTSETFDDLKDSAVVSETENEEVITERSMTSMSNECLPDPSNIDIPDTHSGKYFLLFFFNNTHSYRVYQRKHLYFILLWRVEICKLALV